MSNILRKKKILIVRPTMGQGGADRVTLVLLQQLDRSKYIPILLLMRKEGAYLKEIPEDVLVLSNSTKSLWFFIPSILESIKRSNPDVVFSTCGGANMPLAVVAFLYPFRNWKVILSERNIIFPPDKNRIKRSLMLIAKFLFYRFADSITAVSEGVRTDMAQKLAIPARKIQVVNNPIINEEFFVKAQEAVDHPWFSNNRSIPVILHAGRFVLQKDHATLIRAFSIVQKRINSRLFLLGEGPLVHSIERLIGELGLQKSVQLGGFDINPFKYMAKCDLFVLSSKHEGMPGVLIQAMASGAPCVSTDCPSGPSEIIDKPNENGLLVPVGDINEIANAIVKILTDKNLAVSMSKEGRSSVMRFHVEEAVMSYEQVISK